MFFDEDGDLAHEFYVEVPPSRKGCKATMKKVLHNLIPQASTMQRTQRQSLHGMSNVIQYNAWNEV